MKIVKEKVAQKSHMILSNIMNLFCGMHNVLKRKKILMNRFVKTRRSITFDLNYNSIHLNVLIDFHSICAIPERTSQTMKTDRCKMS